MGLPDIETIPETGAVFTIGRSRFADNIASHFFIRKDPVVGIECGDEHSAVICQTGRLFVFGSNDWGQLGLGHKSHISKPSCVKILKPEKVTHVACGRAHTLICTGAQKIFACGSNQEAQLGRESSAIGDSSSSPILVYDCGLAGPRVVQISAGSHHSMILTSDGGVVGWGSNMEGQLGLPGVSSLVTKPTKIPIPEPVKKISAGYYHSAFLTESGLVYVCGESESGKLGIDVNFSTEVAPKQIQLPAPALHITCGGHHTLVLAENGNIYCFGSNASGQLGLGTNVNEIHKPKLLPRGALQSEKIIKITCGESHSAILTESGKLFTCGDGRHGKLGLEENENNVHEVTFAAKYQELFISNVACGGCHTILVGRRHEMEYPSQRQSDSTEQTVQKKSSLPPLKLPINMQNEHRTENADKLTNERDSSQHADKINETSKTNEINSLGDLSKTTVDIVGNEEISSSAKDKKIASPEKSSALSEKPTEKTENINSKIEESKSINNESELENKETAQNDEMIKGEENDKSKDVEENNENQENNETVQMIEAMTKDAEESHIEVTTTRIQNEEKQETLTNPVPPPKPPRLKSESIGDICNEKEFSRENEEDAHKMERDDKEISAKGEQNSNSTSPEKSISTKLHTITEKIVDGIENSIENIEEEKHADESEKVEMDGTQDDADVVQSPAPRTGKMAKLFKGKRQQEVQNGTKKSSSTTNPKSKSKTCIIL